MKPRRQMLVVIIFSLFVILALGGPLIRTSGNDDLGLTITSSKNVVRATQDAKLVVYTYESLLGDPYYDIEGNFSQFAGISKDEMIIRRFDDANEIVTRLLQERDSPQADVVIGIDNALIHLIEDKSSVLEPLSPTDIPNINALDQNLIQNLDSERYLIPYDYGIISLWYDNARVNASLYPEIENMTLDKLLQSDLLNKLVVENPKFSSPGLGFLLWTIAVYGDPNIDFNGLLGKDWRDWWRQARDAITITKSWGEAFNIFFEPKEDKPIMVSYGTSPAYGYCLGYDGDQPATTALLTNEKGQPNAWLQIEGIGLVKNAPHPDLAKQFINWFIGSDLQSTLPTHQWMYPANTNATIPACFTTAAIHPDNVNRLNDLIPSRVLKDQLRYWQDEWEEIIVSPGENGIISGFDAVLFFLIFGVLMIPLLEQRKKRI